MTSIGPTDKESDSSDTNIASSSRNKEAEIRGKDNETETGTDNTDQDTQVKDFQSVLTQFENPSGDESGNTVVDRGKDCNLVDETGVGHTWKTSNVSHTGKKEDEKYDSKSGVGAFGDSGKKSVTSYKEEKMTQISSSSQSKKQPHFKLEPAGAQFVNPSGDESGNTVVDRVGHTWKTTNTSYTGKKEDEKHNSKSGVGAFGDSGKKSVTSYKEETTKLIPSAQTKIDTKKQVNEKSPSKSERTKPVLSGSEPLETADEGSDREPQIKEGSPQHPPYSGLPQQRPQQIREGTDTNLPWIGIVVVLVSVVCGYYLHFSGSTPNKIPKQLDMVEVFNQEMEKLQASFPSQRPELWKRSLIHIRRHLKTEHPTEPVSLILTSGRRAEKTLGCLAQCLAQAFSTTRNSTFLSIDGKAKTSLDSDQVKLDIDSELTKAFESEKFAAVIHRFEELPPGSTLIFYRYCDHENAAYKNVFLAFTVMLDAEAEVPSNINLGRIEEMVQDHVKQKFVSSDKSAVFNQMDVDKLSGLWSRISHLILPVAAEERIEQHGCRGCDKPF